MGLLGTIKPERKQIEPFLPYIDFFMISGEEEILPVFKEYSRKYECIFNVTLGEAGSVTYSRGNEFRVSAIPVKEVVDTTGCGDSYHAGFVCSYVKYQDIHKAMEEGSRVAAANLAHFGGFEL